VLTCCHGKLVNLQSNSNLSADSAFKGKGAHSDCNRCKPSPTGLFKMNPRGSIIFFVTTALICQSPLVDALRPLIVGLNKYSHDASCCIIDSTNGKVLFSQAKERLSRRKHDGGAIGELLLYGLESIDATIDDVSTVVSNNHHNRVLPFERRLPFYRGLKYTPEDYSDISNLIPNAQHFELSHHLAHAWSVVG
jgi:hypothetical protein